MIMLDQKTWKMISNLNYCVTKAIHDINPLQQTGETKLMCHGPGSLRRMNPELASENDKERPGTKIENDQNITNMEVVVKDSLEVKQEIRRKKI